jgi:hypothetical protein
MVKDTRLRQITFDEFKPLLGKRCKVIANGQTFVGVLQFAGYNKFLGCNQVTLSRMPIFNPNMDSIEVIDEPWNLDKQLKLRKK